MYKKFFPQSLVSRFMLIIILPAILFQCIIIYVFYQRHWYTVAARMSYLIANNISIIIDVANQGQMGLANYIATRHSIVFETTLIDYQDIKNQINRQEFELLYTELGKRFDVVKVVQKTNTSEIFIKQGNLFYHFNILNKPLINFTTDVFMWWWLFSNFLVVIISIVFAKNQIKSILELARVADLLGRGLDLNSNFTPKGAKEIRIAGFAFIKMRNRIANQVNKHTRMLAMISHDLKTPLTRLKLQLEFLSPSNHILLMKNDLDDMNFMIDRYLNFAKGQLIDEFSNINFVDFIKEYFKHFTNTKLQVFFEKLDNSLIVKLNSKSFIRVLDNILSNSSKYAQKVLIYLYKKQNIAYLDIEDDGPGVAEKERNLILQPFYRSKAAKHLNKNSNFGLGLAIASEILKEHHGLIEILKGRRLQGLMIRITLPLAGDKKNIRNKTQK